MPCHNGCGTACRTWIPPHLRHLEARPVFLQLTFKPEAYHLARKQAESRRIAFLAPVEQHLLADADTKQRLGFRGFDKCFLQT